MDLLDHSVTLCLTFSSTAKLFSRVTAFVFTPEKYAVSNFSTPWLTLTVSLFYYSHANACELVSPCTFIIKMYEFFAYSRCKLCNMQIFSSILWVVFFHIPDPIVSSTKIFDFDVV